MRRWRAWRSRGAIQWIYHELGAQLQNGCFLSWFLWHSDGVFEVALGKGYYNGYWNCEGHLIVVNRLFINHKISNMCCVRDLSWYQVRDVLYTLYIF